MMNNLEEIYIVYIDNSIAEIFVSDYEAVNYVNDLTIKKATKKEIEGEIILKKMCIISSLTEQILKIEG